MSVPVIAGLIFNFTFVKMKGPINLLDSIQILLAIVFTKRYKKSDNGALAPPGS